MLKLKVLSVYRTSKGIIVERRNELGIESEQVFDQEKDMLQCLDNYKSKGNLDEYELNVDNEFWAIVVNHLSS